MKALLALAFAAALSNQAFAQEVPCAGGSPDIFKFVKWDLKTVDPETTEVTLTVHNATDQNFGESEIKIRWGEWHQFFFKFEYPRQGQQRHDVHESLWHARRQTPECCRPSRRRSVP